MQPKPTMLFISHKTWAQIRWQFNEAEKAQLRLRILNNVIHPPGVDIDVDKLAPEHGRRSMLFVRSSVWAEIRWRLDEDERQQVRMAITKHVTLNQHQRFNVDTRKLSRRLEDKLLGILIELSPAARREK
jgi:hypothetical protein